MTIFDFVELWFQRSEKVLKTNIYYSNNKGVEIFNLEIDHLYINWNKYKLDKRCKKYLVDYKVKSSSIKNNVLILGI